MNNSIAHQKLFLADPTGVLIKMLFPGQEYSTMEINAANRLLFSMLSNQKFMEWAKSHQEKMARDALEATKIKDPDEAMRVFTGLFDKRKAFVDILHGLKETMDVEIIGALLQAMSGFGSGRGRPVSMRSDGSGSSSVYTETYIFYHVAEIVYAVVVSVSFLGIHVAPIDGVTREDLRNLSAMLAEQIKDRAYKMRESGDLNPLD